MCHTGYVLGYIHVTMSNTLEQTEESGMVLAISQSTNYDQISFIMGMLILL